MTDFQIRFRHVSGDLGPYAFQESVLVQILKDKILSEWPKDGPMAKEPPTQSMDIKLILSGKFLDATKPLKDYRKDMGELQPDTVVTMHVVVRPSAAPKKQPGSAPGQPAEEEQSKGCGCIIS